LNQSRAQVVGVKDIKVFSVNIDKKAGTMLSRTVCTQCRHKHFKGKKSDSYLKKYNRRWYCPATRIHNLMGSVDIEDNPPTNCQYRFEHAVALAGDDNAK
jgi:hypothetical protein